MLTLCRISASEVVSMSKDKASLVLGNNVAVRCRHVTNASRRHTFKEMLKRFVIPFSLMKVNAARGITHCHQSSICRYRSMSSRESMIYIDFLHENLG